jgi:type I restriction enzyme S subunit
MGSGWKTKTLEDVVETIIDYRGKTPKKVDAGIPLITAKIVKDGRIMPADEFIAEEDYVSWMRRGLPQPGDVVITTEAPLGQVAQLDNRKVALAQRLIALRGKNGILDNSFLKYLMQSSDVQEQLRSRSTGTTVVGIKQKELRHIILTIPPYPKQRAIAHILGTLDDKIELNHSMNETLETMARAIFKSWFVDFDPVRAKAEGRDPNLPKEITDLFPDSFQDSELGQIPKGWESGCIGDIGVQIREGVKPDELRPDEPYIALEHMPRKSISLPYWTKSEGIFSNKFRFYKNNILFGKLRPYFHKVGIAAIDGVCSTDIVVIKPNEEHYRGLLLGYLSSDEFVSYVSAASTGTKMPRTNWKDMSRYKITLPQKVAVLFNSIISDMISQIHANIHESRSVESLRDTLLPELISGELRVPDAEKFIEGIG